MSVTLRFPQKGRILFAAEQLEGGRRYLRVRRWFPDGTYRDEYEEVADSDRPLLIVSGGPDIDEIALRDIEQRAAATPPRQRQEKPDIAVAYQDFLENRARELKGRRVYPRGWPKETA